MNDPEAKFWQEIDNSIGGIGEWDRIESHETAPGFPDTDFTINGVDGKIELKFARGGVPEIKDSQYRWFRRRVRAKCNCWLFAKLVEKDETYYVLIHGSDVCRLKRQPWHKWLSLCTCLWTGQVEWETFIELITLRRNDNEAYPRGNRGSNIDISGDSD